MTNPKHLSVRMDPETGELWLTEERYRQGIRKVLNINQHVLLALCADLFQVDGTKEVSRDVRFADGTCARITITDVSDESTGPV